MRLLFPADPLEGRKPDPHYADEVAAAINDGFRYDLIDFEALLGGDVDHAVRRVQSSSVDEMGLYRGWMMTPDAYSDLFEALQARGLRLINDRKQYGAAHYLPEISPFIASRSVATIFIPFEQRLNFPHIHKALGVFGQAAIVLKDYVKSRKHEWNDACYIANASDRAEVERITTNFVTRQGSQLAGGLAYRAFAELRSIGTHPVSGMPLSLEYRAFVIHGELLLCTSYWGVDRGDHQIPQWSEFSEIARQIPSNFFTLDIAITSRGEALIIEAGDGQVSAIPDGTAPALFYQKLATAARSFS